MNNFSEFVESIRRLYAEKSQLSKDFVIKLYSNKKITDDELNYILSEEVHD